MNHLWAWLNTQWSEPGTVAIVGLARAGKSTLRRALCDDARAQMRIGMRVYDLCECSAPRRDWHARLGHVNGILFVVDAADHAAFATAAAELAAIVDALADNRERPPLLVLGNKCDVSDAQSMTTLARALRVTTLAQRYMVALAPCSIRRGEGIQEALAWLAGEMV